MPATALTTIDPGSPCRAADRYRPRGNSESCQRPACSRNLDGLCGDRHAGFTGRDLRSWSGQGSNGDPISMKRVARQMRLPIRLRHGGVDQCPARGARLRARLRRGRLDRELAEGRAPEACGDRALRAGQLTEAVTRCRVARSLRGVVAKAKRAPGGLGSAVPVCRSTVLAWREGLLGLADRARAAGSAERVWCCPCAGSPDRRDRSAV